MKSVVFADLYNELLDTGDKSYDPDRNQSGAATYKKRISGEEDHIVYNDGS